MIDVEPMIKEELDAFVPAPGATRADWSDVRRRAGSTRSPRRIVAIGAALVAVAFVAVAFAQSLDGGFSDWLTGEPGKPASTAQQRAFERAIRSWKGFPQGTELRQLVQTRVGGATFSLYGFRGSGSLCLRLVVSGSESASSLVCPPLSQLRNSAPAVASEVDYRVGLGRRVSNGPFRFQLPKELVTFGIVTDLVEQVRLIHSSGAQSLASLNGDAFLSVDSDLSPTERVTRIWAIGTSGARASIPFVASPGAVPGAVGQTVGPYLLARGPATVQRVVHGGTVAWLAQRKPIGTSVPSSVHHIVGVLPGAVFAREITPNPAAPERLIVSVLPAGGLYFPQGPRNSVEDCVDVVGGRYANTGGGCWAPERMFSTAPFALGAGTDSTGQYVTLAGLASDTVSRLTLFLANRTRVQVPLHDNGYLVEAATADYPLRLVAYDNHGLVIGIETLYANAQPAPPAADQPVTNGHWEIVFNNTIATVWDGPSRSGSTCNVIVYSPPPSFIPPFCQADTPLPANTTGGIGINGTSHVRNITVRVGAGISQVRVRYKNGRTQTIPAKNGYAIARLNQTPPPHAGQPIFDGIASLTGLDAHGNAVAAQQIAGVLVGGSGTIARLSRTKITISSAGTNPTSCAIESGSPTLHGYRSGTHIQYLCQNGELILIAHTTPHAPFPDRTVLSRGSIKSLTATAITINNAFTGTSRAGRQAQTCSIRKASSPSTQSYHRGENVLLFCSHGELTGINRHP